MCEETIPHYPVLTIEDLTKESQALAEDAGIAITEIICLADELAKAREEIKNGAVLSGPEAMMHHARRYAANAIVGFELMRHERVSFMETSTPVPTLLNEKIGTVMMLVKENIIGRMADVKDIYSDAAYCVKQYLAFRDCSNKLK
jgi:hypothetical protein